MGTLSVVMSTICGCTRLYAAKHGVKSVEKSLAGKRLYNCFYFYLYYMYAW